jgi:hypothetical protein
MQKNMKIVNPLRWLAVVVLAITLLSACESKERKSTETETRIGKKDSLPPLDDDDSLSSTRPETIKN